MTMTRFSTRTLLTLAVAALFAASSSSAFSIQRSSSRTLTTTSTSTARIDHSHREGLSAVVAATAPKRSRATTLLFVSPLDIDININIDSEIDEKALSFGKRKRLHNWKCWIQFWRTNAVRSLRERRHNFRLTRAVAASLVSVGSIAGTMAVAPAQPVFARTLQENLEEGTVKYSLRPGVSMAQAEQLASGVMPDEVRDEIDAKTSIGATTGLSKEESVAKAKQKDTLYGDCDDYDDEDYATDEEEFGDSAYGNQLALPKQRQKSFSTDTDMSNEISKGTKTVFTGISKEKPNTLYAKISVACFIPTFGLFGVREFVRSRKEAKYVEKALEIVDAQRAEYFGTDKDGNNITATEEDDDSDSDSDIEDELKDLKDGDDDDDNDDDDDDDDDDEPPRRRRSLPKTPKGPQGDGSGGAGGGFDDFGDDDDDGPSDEDIERLGALFDKS